MQTATKSKLNEPWQAYLDAVGVLPGELLDELDQAWNSLAAYESELTSWYGTLVAEQQRLLAQPPATLLPDGQPASPPMQTPPPSLVPAAAAVDPPPQVMRTLSAAARQFAALRRQKTSQRPLQ